MNKSTLVILAGISLSYQSLVFADSDMFREIEQDSSAGAYYGYEYRDRFPREIEDVRHLRNCGTCRGYGQYRIEEGYEPGANYLNDHR